MKHMLVVKWPFPQPAIFVSRFGAAVEFHSRHSDTVEAPSRRFLEGGSFRDAEHPRMNRRQ